MADPDVADFVDVVVSGGGSLYIFHATSDEAVKWIRENVSPEGYQPSWPRTLIVEHRYARDIAAGMQRDGLRVI